MQRWHTRLRRSRRRSSTRFLVDENVPAVAARFLQEQGHDVLFVAESGLRGSSDDKLIELCAREARVLISMDLGLSAQIEGLETGLILLRFPGRFNEHQVLRLLESVLVLGEDEIQGSITVASPGRTRSRRLGPAQRALR